MTPPPFKLGMGDYGHRTIFPNEEWAYLKIYEMCCLSMCYVLCLSLNKTKVNLCREQGGGWGCRDIATPLRNFGILHGKISHFRTPIWAPLYHYYVFFLLLGGSPKQRIRNVTCNNNDNNKPSPTRHIQTPQQRVEYQHYCTSRAESKPSPTKYSSHPFIDAVITSNRQPGETTVIFILHIYTFFVSNSVA